MENLTDLARLQDDPMAALGAYPDWSSSTRSNDCRSFFPPLLLLADWPDLPASFPLLGFELKANSAPRSTPSMTQAIEDLGLKRVYVVYPGDRYFPLTDRIDAIGITNLPKLAETLAD